MKISEESTTRARTLVKDYIEGQVTAFFRDHSVIEILKLEYTGSFYEGLKTEAADETDITVILKTPSTGIEVIQSQFPGYVRLRASSVQMFKEYLTVEGYINAKKLRNNWFYSLVHLAVNNIKPKSPYSEVRLVRRRHGPAVQVDIFRKGSDENFYQLISFLASKSRRAGMCRSLLQGSDIC